MFVFFSSRHALGPLPPVPGSRIATCTNTAYEMMKQGAQGGRQEGEHEYEVISPPGGPPAGKVPPAPQQPAAVSSEGGTEGEGEMVYENIPGDP